MRLQQPSKPGVQLSQECEAADREMYYAAELLGQFPAESSVEYAHAAQAEVALKSEYAAQTLDGIGTLSFHVYENKAGSGHKAVIHRAECSFCNHGRGIHPDSGDKFGGWYGPFETFQEAMHAANHTGGRVKQCAYCAPAAATDRHSE